MAAQVHSGTIKKTDLSTPKGLGLNSPVVITISDGETMANGKLVPNGIAIVNYGKAGGEHVFGAIKLAEHFNLGEQLQ